ncbi:MAG: ZIP family metal transporter, partial [Janthinobacterium lividum]
PYLVSLAAGVLLATAVLHILPEAIASLGNLPGLWSVFLSTLFILFCIERVFAAATGHAVESPSQSDPHPAHHATRPLGLIFGGILHSFVDGVSVAAAFASGQRVGWLTAGAIMLHEVPHRMGDYALLTHLRVPPRRALQLILLIAVAAIAGVMMVLVVGHAFSATGWLLPVSAGSFLYIAMVDLMPELAGERRLPRVLAQLLCMLGGAGLVALLLKFPS